jgi:DNA-binding transcriptional ArsR family regulator
MSVTITINNGMEIADKEIEKLSQDLSQDERDTAVFKILDKYEVSLCNGSFSEIFEMLGHEINTIDVTMIGQSTINVPYDYEYDIEGVELEILKERIKNLLVIIEKNPKQFKTITVKEKYLNGLTVYKSGKDPEYYIRKLKKILELAESTDKIRIY